MITFVVREDVYEGLCKSLEIEKAHKYIRRYKKAGKNNWLYVYHGNKTNNSSKQRKQEKIKAALKSAIITNIKPLSNPTTQEINNEFSNLRNLSKTGKLKVKAYGNFPIIINKKSYNHLFSTKGQARLPKTIQERAELLPFVADILNNTGVLGEKSVRRSGTTYGILGRCNVNGVIKTVEISLAFDEKSRLFFLSNYEIKKALPLTTIMENESLSQLDNALSFIRVL